MLDALLTQFKSENRKVLIYTQMLKTLQLLELYCKLKNYKYESLMGSNSIEARARAIGSFNKNDSDDFIFILQTRSGRQGVNLTTADRVIIFDVDFDGQQDLQAIGRESKQNQSEVEIYRLVSRNSVEEIIADIMERKLILDYASVKNNTNTVASDCAVLKHILENGCRQILESDTLPMSTAEDNINRKRELQYLLKSDSERQDCIETQFNDFKSSSDQFWIQQYPE